MQENSSLTLMSPEKLTLEAAVDLQRAKTAVLQALENRGYRIETEYESRVIAKHTFSATYYPHQIEVHARS